MMLKTVPHHTHKDAPKRSIEVSKMNPKGCSFRGADTGWCDDDENSLCAMPGLIICVLLHEAEHVQKEAIEAVKLF
eukprot:3569681-Amphidinium_carterae.1